MDTSFQSFEDLRIWKEGMKLCREVYTVLKLCKDFGIKDQMQRSALSIPSNIAEGSELSSNKAFIRHLFIAKGSAGELRTQLYIAVSQGIIEKTKGEELINSCKRLGGMIYKFIDARKKVIRPV